MIKLNILDQSPIVTGQKPEDSLKQTIELAVLADNLGYNRYWVAEHHDSLSFASASPEILIPVIAGKTKNIRVGSGCVLISHYSPLKIAEQFKLLECLYPGRIDLGIGRAPGGNQKIIRALRSSNEDAFSKTSELINYFSENKKQKYDITPSAVPDTTGHPEFWILGTSPDSAMYAAKNGLAYAFGSFISDEYMLQCFQIYYQNFSPSIFLKQPYLNLALFVLCSETREKAVRLAKCSEYWLAQTFLHAKNISFPDEKTYLNHEFSPEEKMLIDYRRKSALIGDAGYVSENIKELAVKYAIHEFTLVTITSDFEDRKKSYRLIVDKLSG